MGMLMHRTYLENQGAAKTVAPNIKEGKKVEVKPKEEKKPSTKK